MLQLSLDWLTIESAIETIRELEDLVDIAEVGTPMIFDYGLDAVKMIKDSFPQMTVLADMKIMDAGKLETKMAGERKADIVTVMAAANNMTILSSIDEAHSLGIKVMVDLLGVSDNVKRAIELDRMGADYICLHTAYDIKSNPKRPVEDLVEIGKVLQKSKTAIAGGITLKNLESIMTGSPDIVIVGGGILDFENKRSIAEHFNKSCGLKNIK